MESQANFESTLHFVRQLSSAAYTPRVDSQYDHQSHILHYHVELPGVQRRHVKVIIGYSTIFQQQNIVVWGMSLAPHWPTQSMSSSHSCNNSAETTGRFGPLVDSQSSSRELHGYIGPPEDATLVPFQETMERVHGEFYRVLPVPAKTQVSLQQWVYSSTLNDSLVT